MQTNIEKFNYYVGYFFAELQENFPCRTKIDFLKAIEAEQCPETYSNGGVWTGKYIRAGEIQDVSADLEFVYETIVWLFETGYLQGTVGVTPLGKSAFVTLSPKALEILKVIPGAIDSKSEGKTIGQELTEAVRGAAKAQVADAASRALSYLFKVSWNAVSQHNSGSGF